MKNFASPSERKSTSWKNCSRKQVSVYGGCGVRGAGCRVQGRSDGRWTSPTPLASVIQQEKTNGAITTGTIALLFKPAPCTLASVIQQEKTKGAITTETVTLLFKPAPCTLASVIQQEKTNGAITTETVALLFKPAPCPLSPAPFMIVMEFP